MSFRRHNILPGHLCYIIQDVAHMVHLISPDLTSDALWCQCIQTRQLTLSRCILVTILVLVVCIIVSSSSLVSSGSINRSGGWLCNRLLFLCIIDTTSALEEHRRCLTLLPQISTTHTRTRAGTRRASASASAVNSSSCGTSLATAT